MMVYYAYEPDDHSLEAAWHHGVPNQRWGVRNGPPYPVQSGTKVRFAKSKMTESTRARYKKEHGGSLSKEQKRELIESRMPRQLHRLAVSRLSDEQLKNRVARLELESKYKKLLYESRHGGGSETKKKDNSEKKTESTLGKFGDTLTTELVKLGADYAKTRLNQHAANVSARKQPRADYLADKKRAEYESRAKSDRARNTNTKALNDFTDTGRRIFTAFESTRESGDIPWGYDDDLPY